MNTITLVNCIAYKTSKSLDAVEISGVFEITDKVLNSRCKLVEKGTETVYWLDKDQLEVSEEYKETESETLIIEEKRPTKEKPVDVYYTVKRGDTVQSIASQFGVPTSSIINSVGSTTVAIGQKVRIS